MMINNIFDTHVILQNSSKINSNTGDSKNYKLLNVAHSKRERELKY